MRQSGTCFKRRKAFITTKQAPVSPTSTVLPSTRLLATTSSNDRTAANASSRAGSGRHASSAAAGDALRRDVVTIKPHQVIIVGILIAAGLVVALLILVRIITRNA